MHAPSGDKTFGIKVEERSKGLMATLAAIPAGASAATRPKRSLQPNRLHVLHESASDVDKKAKVIQLTEAIKKTKSDGNEVDEDEGIEAEAAIGVNIPAEDSNPAYMANRDDSEDSDSDDTGEVEVKNDGIASLLPRKTGP
ncbi:hypothetical protein M422DRAFT_251947 [Sphaerobolus stellatus SS14]|uniref:Uncharacterized protein n=1 Tax=Sphaerobolus stellatus (strain SS14) TaxID=990650 RepID=A0A0C9VQN8_SPHS4|nr:hypothetical protein M422DRAFT_251947 [Sphaerobolus stellatus SS14]